MKKNKSKQQIMNDLIDAGYTVEVIKGYLDMGKIEKAQEHLEHLNWDLMKALKGVNNLNDKR